MSHQPRVTFAVDSPTRTTDQDSTQRRISPRVEYALSSRLLEMHNANDLLRDRRPCTPFPTVLEKLHIEIPSEQQSSDMPSYRRIINARLNRQMSDTAAISASDCDSNGFVFCLDPCADECEEEMAIYDEFGPITPPSAHVGKNPIELERIPTNVTMIIRDDDENDDGDDADDEDQRPDFPSEKEEDNLFVFPDEDDSPDVIPQNVLLSQALVKQPSNIVGDGLVVPSHSDEPTRMYQRHVRDRFESMLSFLDAKIEAQKHVCGGRRRTHTR